MVKSTSFPLQFMECARLGVGELEGWSVGVLESMRVLVVILKLFIKNNKALDCKDKTSSY